MNSSSEATPAPSSRTPRKRGCLFFVRRGLLALVLLIAVLCLLGFTYESIMRAGDAERFPPPGQLVDVDGYAMHIRCLGEGSPTVILESGAGGFSMMWSESLVTQLSQTTRVCAYDRAGYGWSDARPEPRTPWEIAHELHSLLENAAIEFPYVLVGVSNGGLYVRSFAAEYPQDIAGMVLSATTSEATVDSTKSLSSTIFIVMGRLGIFRLFPDMICPGTACDEAAKPIITAFRGRETLFQTYDNEWAQLLDSEQLGVLRERISPAGTLGDIPLIVLAANQTGLPNDEIPADYRATLDDEQDLMTGLSSKARYVRVASGHGLDIEHPDLVIESVNAVVEAARTGEPLAE